MKKQLKIIGTSSSAYKDMSDAEYVLRFLTLNDRLTDFSGKLAHEMNDFMEKHQQARNTKVGKFASSFTRAISGCEQLWGENAIKRPEGDGWRDQLLAGMFHAQMLSVAKLSDPKISQVARRADALIAGTRSLFDDAEFEKAVRTGTNTPARIKYRVEEVTKLLQSV